MIKTFEQYSDSRDEKNLFINRIKSFFDDKPFFIEIIDGGEIIEINDEDGKLYIDFYLYDNFYKSTKRLDKFFKEIDDNINIDYNKIDKIDDNIVKKYKVLISYLLDFINMYYQKEYDDYKKEKEIKKFNI